MDFEYHIKNIFVQIFFDTFFRFKFLSWNIINASYGLYKYYIIAVVAIDLLIKSWKPNLKQL